MPCMYMSADEVAEWTGMSKSYAFKLIRRLNDELEHEGYVTIPGKVEKRYFAHRLGIPTEALSADGGEE